jgi:hypothetical protein
MEKIIKIILFPLIFFGCLEDKKPENSINYNNSNYYSNSNSSEYNYSKEKSATSGKTELGTM